MCSGLGTLERQNNTAREKEAETEVENIALKTLNIVSTVNIVNMYCNIVKLSRGFFITIDLILRWRAALTLTSTRKKRTQTALKVIDCMRT